MHNVKYSFSSVQVNLPDQLAQKIIKWGKDNIPDEDLYKEDNGHLGREDEIHVTVLYGLHSESPIQTKELTSKVPAFPIELTTISLFTTNDLFDVIKIGVDSSDLVALNEKLRKNVQHTNKHGAYQPHITVAYVKKGLGWKYNGMAEFDGEIFTANHVIFSSRSGTKERIPLTAK